MRTAPFVPYPLYVLPLPDAGRAWSPPSWSRAARRSARVNGALPTARQRGRRAGAAHRRRASTCTSTCGCSSWASWSSPPLPPGRLHAAPAADAALSLAWFRAFEDAAEQAGRTAPDAAGEHFDAGGHRSADRRRAGSGCGRTRPATPVHLTAFNPPAFGVARVGPVYTPAAHRGHGYASAAVAARVAAAAGPRARGSACSPTRRTRRRTRSTRRSATSRSSTWRTWSSPHQDGLDDRRRWSRRRPPG